MQPVPSLSFEHAIKFPDGTYYTGPDWSGPGGTRKDNATNRTSVPMDIYTYTEARAHQLIKNNPVVFAGCTVEKV